MRTFLASDAKGKCSLCGEIIPEGHRYFKKTKYSGREHTNCALYSTLSHELMIEAAERESIAKYNVILGLNKED